MLVTGASGFIGGRLVERLVVEHGARVRVLVRRVMGAARLARFPVEIAVGDMADPRSAAAFEGCDFIFNCAKGAGADRTRRRAVDVDGVRRLIGAAKAAGARVVHLSTMAVYDLPRDGEVDERAPAAPPGDIYTDDKLEGERLARALGAQHGVPVTVLQPAVVYGPFAGLHGADILHELRAGPALLVDGGAGICNLVYVDDLVTAMILAATCDRAVGARILVSGPEHPTWRDFYAAFEGMLGMQRVVSLSEREALELWRRSRRRAWLLPEALRAVRGDEALRRRLLATREGQAVHRAIQSTVPGLLTRLHARLSPGGAGRTGLSDGPMSNGESAPAPLRPWVVKYMAKRCRVRIDRARDLLGYQPVFRMADGMRLTEAWARWARLLS